tara:strand:+ start:182 stop:388 length:207 start_codon:yes stop_codon:yes gene_type:complete
MGIRQTVALGDKVVITNKGGLIGEVVGFYSHTMGAVVRTETGNEWIICPSYLEVIRGSTNDISSVVSD